MDKQNMYTKSRKLVLASAISLATFSVSGTVFADTLSQDITEARQETQIWTTYVLNSYLSANDLKVSVDNGTATLTGTVEENVSKELARQIALGVSGITKVDNQIKIEPDYVSPARNSEERTFGEVVDDATITTSVKSKLLWSKNTEGLDMNVDTNKGHVSLHGSVESGAAKELAGRMAMNTRGVKSLDNQLAVDKRLAMDQSKAKCKDGNKNTGNDKSHAVADSWITTKVKSTYMYSSNVASHDISVSTEAGIVTLNGTVSSGAERDLAIELAQNIRGVNSVNATALTF